MTNREAQIIRDKLEIAMICCSHALEEPMSVESYLHIIMDELEICQRYVTERQGQRLFERETKDDDL